MKIIPKRLRVYTVEKEVAKGFRLRLTKGAGVSSVANPMFYNLVYDILNLSPNAERL